MPGLDSTKRGGQASAEYEEGKEWDEEDAMSHHSFHSFTSTDEEGSAKDEEIARLRARSIRLSELFHHSTEMSNSHREFASYLEEQNQELEERIEEITEKFEERISRSRADLAELQGYYNRTTTMLNDLTNEFHRTSRKLDEEKVANNIALTEEKSKKSRAYRKMRSMNKTIKKLKQENERLKQQQQQQQQQQ